MPDPKQHWSYLNGRAASLVDDASELAKWRRRRAAWESLRVDVVAKRCPSFAQLVDDFARRLLPALSTHG